MSIMTVGSPPPNPFPLLILTRVWLIFQTNVHCMAIGNYIHIFLLLFIPVGIGFFSVDKTLTVELSKFNAAVKEEDFLKTI